MMSNSEQLIAVDHRQWIPGFRNLLVKENQSWWRTRKWLANVLVWTVIVNGLLATMIWLVPATDPEEVIPTDELQGVFFTIFGAFATIGVIVIAQGAIVGEKRSGTAEWVMSNPVSPAAFILSKVFGNIFGILVTIVLLQSGLFYLQLSLRNGELLDLKPYAAATALLALSFVFYLTLTIMLSAFFKSRGPIVGIALAVFIGQDLTAGLLSKFVPWLYDILPSRLIEYAGAIALDQPLPNTAPLVLASVMSVLFTAAAIWRFGREEY
jgi:ABC-2 type transport system permease protein